jgi:cytochrome c-type biogenesis protein CcmH
VKRWLPVLVLAVVMAGAVVAGSRRGGHTPTVNERVLHIAKEVRCPTCESLSAAESDAPASEAIRAQIKSQVEAGYSDAQVRAYLVDRYGQDILLRPQSSGVSALVWALPVAGGVLGLAGLVVVFRGWRRRRVGGPAVSEEDRSLVAAALGGQQGEGEGAGEGDDEELVFLLTSLADLDRERAAGDIEDADYSALRDDYTARAAARLRGERVVSPTRTRRSLRPIVVGAGVLALAGVAGMAVARTAGERVPGQTVAGGITETSGERLARAAALAGQGKLLDAIKLYDQVIKDDPQNAQALAYRGWLVRLAGRSGSDAALIDKGLSYVERAIAADPKYPDAHFFRGEILLRDKHDAAGAIPEFEAFLSGGGEPDMASLVQQELDAAKQAVGGGAGGASPGG